MLNVTGICKVTKNIEDFQKCTVASLYWSEKDQQENWDTFYVEAVFVGEAFKKKDQLAQGIKIALTKAFLKQERWSKGQKNFSKHKLLITDFEVWEDGEAKEPDTQSNTQAEKKTASKGGTKRK